MTAPRVGSLCSGYGGLDLAAEAVFDARTVWHCEIEAAPSKVLAHRWPNVPNLGDLTAVNWAAVEPVDVMTAGYPCQPFSHAGQRKGTDDERHLWPYVAAAVRGIRPRFVLLENVAGHRSMGFDAVLGDLAACGYDTQWTSVRASDVGAPHGRERLFILAADAAGSQLDRRPGQRGRQPDTMRGVAGLPPQRGGEVRPQSIAADTCGGSFPRTATAGYGLRLTTERRDRPAADTDGAGSQGGEPAAGRNLPDRCAAADTARDGRHERRAEPARIIGGPDAPERRNAVAPDTDSASGETRSRRQGTGQRGRLQPLVRGDTDWGAYEPAIRRWERLTRPAPAPTEPGPRGGQRLSPRFVEWMMGLSSGWVTDIPGLSRNDQLRMLGNGVVPQQATAALCWLLDRLKAAA